MNTALRRNSWLQRETYIEFRRTTGAVCPCQDALVEASGSSISYMTLR